ncbi:ribosome assembly RNA-binding protein YhbY [Deefgea salmonis]|uniref:Ribosome assembly RNA-binding protein YhbY n=1 Tax=Deefgea salmonis TaxID=2875502 RepID=A0ABS8BI48_9NEIS|nr:ribosome assembly RNA-binding protein YhbY [Deefgea salmonis]MCB5195384.1 ribosome assembly RNA-binding protein YhbY [Deefgea salmonis]
MLQLTADQCRHLRSLAHHLNPVVMIGSSGLTEAVMREIAVNLDAHELIKVRVLGDDREARVQFMEKICADLGASPVQHLGKLLLIFRPNNTDKPKILLPKPKKVAK